ncbi:cobalamin biosynthesis protein CbiG / Cobalt-precorrin-3b C17-methyltransferase [Pseudanabaena sp. lw0831]|uniref:precorrin-3B C(17)-methyltransferase n=1 Tax=Pseudanabaena sp. lw0831 TaxID=1357935 RepID=UPI0019168963|nr:precorrin-3B C(17)-methyltransferase [Pseudanabaena sp. lw0831]GBO55528.1 cobalamin biosynthesis protein CbiG / Cobalt-precorrin-3b C17-methyltransferase [Pseudanabaena sp. lw0831]
MKPLAIIILGEKSIAIARQIQAVIPDALIYGLASRTQTADRQYDKFSETVSELFSQGHPIIGICAAGILIRSLAPLLSDKRAEPPIIAIAEDGSAVVPLLGGLNGANEIARAIAKVLQVQAAITTTGDLRFQTALLAPPLGYRLLNDNEQAKTFLADLLAGKSVQLIGAAPWLSESNLPFADPATHIIEVISNKIELEAIASKLSSTHLIYQIDPLQNQSITGKLSIIGTGPGAAKWMSPEVKAILEDATDFVGYKTYINLVKEFTKGKIIHASDNRVELDRARLALNLATEGKSVVIVSSGDPGIYGMAAAVFEVLDHEDDSKWNQIDIHVAPGISAAQAAAAAIGAPIGHDFCTISLSDILKPWEVIERRLAAAAQADFAIAIYNPISSQRKWQLPSAKEILLQWRSPDTPVILGHKMGRKGENVRVIKLAELTPELADMQTVIIIGSSKTKTLAWGDRIRVYTPRKYN